MQDSRKRDVDPRVPAPGLLKISVLWCDLFVGELEISRGESFTVGRGRECNLVLAGHSVEDALQLFVPTTDGWKLRCSPLVHGGVWLNGKWRDVEFFQSGNGTNYLDADGCVRLGHIAAGRLTIGNVTLLFEIIPVDDARPQSAWPSSLKDAVARVSYRVGGVSREIVWLLAASAWLHFLVAFCLAAVVPLPSEPLEEPDVEPPYKYVMRVPEGIFARDFFADRSACECSGVCIVRPRVQRELSVSPGFDPHWDRSVAFQGLDDIVRYRSQACRQVGFAIGRHTSLGGLLAHRDTTMHRDRVTEFAWDGYTAPAVDLVQDIQAQPTYGRRVVLDADGQLLPERWPRSRVQTAEFAAIGADSPNVEDFAHSLETVLPHLQACYETALSGTAGLSGQIRLQVTVRDSGTVVDARLRRSSFPRHVDRCMVHALRRARFHASAADSVTLRMTYSFTPDRE